MRHSLTTLAVLLAASAFAERQPFERYQTIVDRQMFGEPPPGFDPSKMPNEVAKTSAREEKQLTQEQEQVKRSLRYCLYDVTAGVVSVGFIDSSDAKTPRNYFLKVGESSEDGWTVKAADAGEMTVEKDGVEVTLAFGGEAGGEAKGKAGGDGAVRRPGLLGSARPGAGGGMSFRERRRMQEQAAQEDAAKRAEEARQREALEAEDRAQREEERLQQREQLMRIQEELRKAREQREKERASAAETEE